MKAVVDFVVFYLGWFACVGGAAHGCFALGPVVTTVIVAAHLALGSQPSQQLRFLVAAALLGFVADTALASLGFFAFAGTSVVPWISPPWMVALWVLFAATFDGALAWLRRRYIVGAIFGAVGGPISYVVGARLGAIALSPDIGVTLVGIGAAWAVFVPLLLWLKELTTASLAQCALPPPQ